MVNLWLDRFVQTEVIGETSAFRIVACRDVRTGVRLTVVAGFDEVALDALYAAHLAPAHPIVARATERGPGYVTFDFPARIDLDHLLQLSLEGGWKASYSDSDGFTTTLRDALLASPTPLGIFSHGNVLFAADGRHVLIGFGHNVCVHDGVGRIVAATRFFHAPEIAVGGAPSRGSDLLGMIEMTRATMAFVRVHEAIARVLVGNTLREDAELTRLVLWFETRVVRSVPATRPTVEEIITVSNRIRELLGSVPNPEGFRAFVANMLAVERPHFNDEGRTLALTRDGSWFQVGSEQADLRQSLMLARVLCALAEQRRDAPGRSVSVDALVRAGWPDEELQREAGQHRLYGAIASLRRAGLGDDLEREDGGYRLSPETLVRFVDGPSA